MVMNRSPATLSNVASLGRATSIEVTTGASWRILAQPALAQTEKQRDGAHNVHRVEKGG